MGYSIYLTSFLFEYSEQLVFSFYSTWDIYNYDLSMNVCTMPT